MGLFIDSMPAVDNVGLADRIILQQGNDTSKATIEQVKKAVGVYNMASALKFNDRVDRNWNGLGVLAATAKDVTADFNAGTLSTKIAANNFDDYDLGMQIKKNITIDGTSYLAHIIFAHANAFFGYASYAMVNTPNIACVVYVEGYNKQWNSANTDGGYLTSNLRTEVQKVVEALKTALGASHMISHNVLLSNATANGKSSNWTWVNDSFGEALSCAQMYGISVSGSYFDTGEAYEHLALFKKVRPNQVYGNVNIWNRDVLTASLAAHLGDSGYLGNLDVTHSLGVSVLILLK